jgi:hypothetical protein
MSAAAQGGMRKHAFLVLAATAAATVWACSSSEEDLGEDEAAVTEDRVVDVAECTLAELPKDRSTLVAPAAPEQKPHHFPTAAPTDDQVLTKLTLKAKITKDGDKRDVTALTAEVKRGDAEGTMTFAVEKTGVGSTDRKDGSGYAYRAFTKSGPSTVTIGDKSTEIDAVTLHRENSGAGWVMMGTQPDGNVIALTATAPSCSFQLEGWRLLADPSCDEPSDAGPPSCAIVESDGGTTKADAAPEAAAPPADAGTDASETPDSGSGGTGGAGTGGSGTGGGGTGGGGYTYPSPGTGPSAPDRYTGNESSYGEIRSGGSKKPSSDIGDVPDGSTKLRSKKESKAKASEEGGCSAAPGSNGFGAGPILALGVALAALSRRARARR